MSGSEKGPDYIVSIIYQILHVVPTGTVASELDELTTGPACRGAAIRETGVCFFSIGNRGT